MHTHSLEAWRHSHIFLGRSHEHSERRTWLVVALTVTMMVAEIIGGSLYGSMALVADGWHMATHAAALLISAGAYAYARRQAQNPKFSFGTGKVGDLAGFTSAIVLALVAIGIAYHSAERLIAPVTISFREAMAIAVLGLAVNLLSAWLLTDHDDDHHDHHHHSHAHDSGHHAHNEDRNRRAALAHVLADAATSVLAIGALIAADIFQWRWIDPVVGMVGALLILIWSIGLLRSTSAVLLDTVPDSDTARAIGTALETNGDRVADLHVWRLGPGHMAAIVSIVTHNPRPPQHYKDRLRAIPGLSHTTVEVNLCA